MRIGFEPYLRSTIYPKHAIPYSSANFFPPDYSTRQINALTGRAKFSLCPVFPLLDLLRPLKQVALVVSALESKSMEVKSLTENTSQTSCFHSSDNLSRKKTREKHDLDLQMV